MAHDRLFPPSPRKVKSNPTFSVMKILICLNLHLFFCYLCYANGITSKYPNLNIQAYRLCTPMIMQSYPKINFGTLKPVNVRQQDSILRKNNSGSYLASCGNFLVVWGLEMWILAFLSLLNFLCMYRNCSQMLIIVSSLTFSLKSPISGQTVSVCPVRFLLYSFVL